MPVPSSFNDITADRSLQNFVGWVWYERTFYVAAEWLGKRIVIRVDSAHYNAVVVSITLDIFQPSHKLSSAVAFVLNCVHSCYVQFI